MKVTVETNFGDLNRLSRTQTYLAICQVIAMRGTCRRAQVGCVITQENRIVSTGYNGSLLERHCMNCDLSQKCQDAVHAEANAIAFAAKQGIKLDGARLYCTYAPCYDCSKLIVQAGILEVHYELPYAGGNDGIILMELEGVRVTQYKEQDVQA